MHANIKFVNYYTIIFPDLHLVTPHNSLAATSQMALQLQPARSKSLSSLVLGPHLPPVSPVVLISHLVPTEACPLARQWPLTAPLPVPPSSPPLLNQNIPDPTPPARSGAPHCPLVVCSSEWKPVWPAVGSLLGLHPHRASQTLLLLLPDNETPSPDRADSSAFLILIPPLCLPSGCGSNRTVHVRIRVLTLRKYSDRVIQVPGEVCEERPPGGEGWEGNLWSGFLTHTHMFTG